MSQGPRVLIVGASGSGKTTMARTLSKAAHCDLLELDPVHWAGAVGVQRDENEATDIVATFAMRPRWVIEGVYGWLAAAALPQAQTLIWLDMPWSVCRDGLTQRGPWKGASAEAHAAFLDWAEAYWSRDTSCSFAGHRRMFDAFPGPKFRLRSRESVEAHCREGLRGLPGC